MNIIDVIEKLMDIGDKTGLFPNSQGDDCFNTETEMAKLTNEQKEGLLKAIARVNKELEGIVKNLVETSFNKPLFKFDSNCDVDRIARALSDRFKYFRFSVSYEDGSKNLFAHPVFKPHPSVDQLLDESLKNAEHALLNWPNIWPSFEVIESFVCGFQKAFRNYKELEEKLETLKRKNEDYEPRGFRMPFHPMMYPYIR